MLSAILFTVALVCATFPSAEPMLAGTENQLVPSRPEMMRMIDGDTVESRLYLERCTQSSLHASCVFAIDDDVNQEVWTNQCAITTADMKPFWEARFESPAYITRVQILGVKNVGERGFDALTDFQLLIGKHVCVNYKSYSSFSNKTFSCDTFGDSIRIQSSRPHSVLALCEVLAFGKYVKLERKDKWNGGTNLYYRQCLASGSSAGNCHLALDGDLEQSKPDRCYVSEPERAPWLEVILRTPSLIRRVVISNRVDCCQDMLNNFEVIVDGQLCFRYDKDKGFAKEEFFCGRFGSTVRLTITKPGDKNQLMLCELQVLGFETKYLPLGNLDYVGCFRESRQVRDLQLMVAMDNMSVEKCERMCRRRKKPFLGLQQGRQCWCSERYGTHGELSKQACWMQCDGNPRDYCGAKLVNLVYRII